MIEVADFLEDEDMEAADAGAARRTEKGTVVVAVHMVNRLWRVLRIRAYLLELEEPWFVKGTSSCLKMRWQ